MKKFLLFVFIIIIGVSSTMSVYSEPDTSQVAAAGSAAIVYDAAREMRGVWVATVNNLNFPSKTGLSTAELKAELDTIVKTAKDAGLNAIFFQVRPCADAFYDSAIFPTSKYLSGTQGDSFKDKFDPLTYIIDAAHKDNIQLHAWVNPFRVTNGNTGAPELDLDKLAANHPARKNPSYVVKYADGRMYFNPGMPEVQELVVKGVLEIVKNYNVDGIHFDDYFYPYPVNVTQNGKSVPAVFDDLAAYTKYGKSYKTLEDFRRATVNNFVKRVHTEIKAVKKEVRFGISPFGIWSNKSASNPAGSDTAGLDAYKTLTCDAASWVKGGYIDYICPQLYWSFGTKAAPFDVLVRWWSTLCDGTGVDLYIGHGIYKLNTDIKNDYEILRQIEYSRSYITKGSLFYGYKDLVANSYSIKDKLATLYKTSFNVTTQKPTGSGVAVGRPADNTNVSEANIYIMGTSDPAYPVTYEGTKVTRTRSGYFSAYVPLAKGKNTFKFASSAASVSRTIYRGGKPADEYKYPQMDSYKIELTAPTADIVAFPKDKVQIKVQAPAGSKLTAKLGGLSIDLVPLTMPPDEGRFMTEVYSGTITLPDSQPNKTLLELGNITFTATRGKEKAELKGPKVSLINESVYTACEVVNDYSHIKISTTSSFYDDYTPASVGMRDYIIGFKDKYYKLRFGGYVHMDNVVLTPERTLFDNRIYSAATENVGTTTDIRIGVTENVPVSAKCLNGVFRVTLYNTPSDAIPNMGMGKNPIFKTVKATYDKTAQSVSYTFELINADNFYGFDIVYESGFIVLNVRNPITKKTTPGKPLDGYRIAVDPGHGGTDSGALGFGGKDGKNEKDLNLEVALVLRDRLKALGADVFMMRETDKTVTLEERMVILNRQNPDLCISVHHNSMGDTSNNTLTRGVLGLYCSDSGRLLAKCVSAQIASNLNRMGRTPKYQNLAVMRNHKFPGMLAEMAFLTNPDEYEVVTSKAAISRSADAIVYGILDWFDCQAEFLK